MRRGLYRQFGRCWLVGVWLVFVVLCSPCLAGEETGVAQPLDELKALVKDSCSKRTDEQGSKDYLAFHDLLAKIGKTDVADRGKESEIDGILVRLARNRSAQAKGPRLPPHIENETLPVIGYPLHDELVMKYKRERHEGPNPLRTVWKRPPPLSPEHCTEQYVVVWESIILAPEWRGKQVLAARYAYMATATLKAPESLPTFVAAYRYSDAADPKDVDELLAIDRRRNVLAALSSYRSRPALDAVLQCMAIDTKQPDAQPDGEDRRLDEWAILCLTSAEDKYRLVHEEGLDGKAHVESWRKVVLDYKDEDAPNERAGAFLKTLKTRLAEGASD